MTVEADVAAFARAMAHVSDPFVDRNAQLASLGMSDAAWRDLELGWYREFEQRTRLGDRGLVDVSALAPRRVESRAGVDSFRCGCCDASLQPHAAT